MRKLLLVMIISLIILTSFTFQTYAQPTNYSTNEILVKSKTLYLRTSDALNKKYNIILNYTSVNNSTIYFNNTGLNRLFVLKSSSTINVEQAVIDYKNDPSVEDAQPNYIYNASNIPNDPSFNLLWSFQNTGQTVNGVVGTAGADIKAPGAWDINTGNNIIVAVIDSGVDYNRPDLAANMWTDAHGSHGYNFVGSIDDPMDDYGHGTHCAGIIGAVTNNGVGTAGTSWNVRIMAIKVFGATGSGKTSNIINGINYAVSNGASILSNSYATYVYDKSFYDAVKATRDAGLIFIAAAGNALPNSAPNNNDVNPAFPAAFGHSAPSGYSWTPLDNVISVAATNQNDNLASFSNYGGTTVDLGAPGVNIYSTVPTGTCSLCNPSGYKYLDGTSMATPFVTGVAALIKSQYPSITYLNIKNKILGSVDALSSLNGKTITGGRLNAYNSLLCDQYVTGYQGCWGRAPGSSWCFSTEKHWCTSDCVAGVVSCIGQGSESDGGKDYLTKGTCTHMTGCTSENCQQSTKIDGCVDTNNLNEWYVDTNGYCAQETKDCRTLGSYYCSDGACKPLCNLGNKCDGLIPGTGCCVNCYFADISGTTPLFPDGVVNMKDVALLAGKSTLFNKRCGDPNYDVRADINRDCIIDMKDIAIAVAGFGKYCPVTPSTVPKFTTPYSIVDVIPLVSLVLILIEILIVYTIVDRLKHKKKKR